jgi:uncharacterized protein with NRDE domain
MCTLTIAPRLNGQNEVSNWRLSFNRDEQRSRPAAVPPQRGQAGRRLAVYPRDPVSQGAWLGLNDAGFVAALLNINLLVPWRNTPKVSRGRVVPWLLELASVEAALERLFGLEVHGFAPFRVVLLRNEWIAQFSWDGRRTSIVAPSRLSSATFFTSSALGDALVDPPRRRLFKAVAGNFSSDIAQDAFHSRRDAKHPELGVNMSRRDAATVSYSVVENARDFLRFSYWPDGPTDGPPATTIELRRGDRSVA